MHTVNFEEIVDRIVTHDTRYGRGAYGFVREALDFTQQRVHKAGRDRRNPKERHVTGQQLLEGIRDYALQSMGPMALLVFHEWGLRCCEDFGEIVFNLVEHGRGMFGKTDQDSREHFKSGYDFEQAFRNPYLPSHRLVRPATARSH